MVKDFAGNKDYIQKLNAIEKSREAYVKGHNTPPGVPTQKGLTGDVEFISEAYPVVEFGNYDIPEGWENALAKPTQTGVPAQWENPNTTGFESDGSEETNLYFFHTDHLGSTNYLTDKDGVVQQSIVYQPYGEVLYEEKTYSNPYKFNGKELDTETGLAYYGARYYEPKLALFYGIDRYTEKFPWQSAYCYAGGNPVGNIDINGDSIITQVNGIDYKYSLKSNCFVDANGGEYTGNNENIIELTQALKTLSKTNTGNCLLLELSENEKNVIICASKRNAEAGIKDDARYSSRVLWNSKRDAAFGGGSFVSLAHELGHTLDRFRGTLDMSTWFVTSEGKHIPNAEKFSTFIENKIRYENNLPLRRAYVVDINNEPCSGWVLDKKQRALYFDTNGKMSNKRVKGDYRYKF